MPAPKQPMSEGAKAGIFGVVAVLYCISPIDLVPEAIFGPFGLADDAIAILSALGFVVKAVIFPKRPNPAALKRPTRKEEDDEDDEPPRRKRRRRDWDDDEEPRLRRLSPVRVAKVLALPQATRVTPDVAETAARAAVDAVAKGIEMTEQMKLALFLYVRDQVKAAL